MWGLLLSLLLGCCLAGLAVTFYLRLVGYDAAQPRSLRVAIVIGAEFLGALCLLAGHLAAARFGWGGSRGGTPSVPWFGIVGGCIGAGIVVVWREYHRKPKPNRPWDPPGAERDPLA